MVLAGIKGIVKGHGGRVQVQSKVGKDSRFSAVPPKSPPRAEKEPPEGMGEGGEADSNAFL